MRYEWSNERGPTANQDCQRELEDKSVRYKVRVYIVQYRCTLYNTGVHCSVQYECTLYSMNARVNWRTRASGGGGVFCNEINQLWSKNSIAENNWKKIIHFTNILNCFQSISCKLFLPGFWWRSCRLGAGPGGGSPASTTTAARTASSSRSYHKCYKPRVT